MLKKLFDFLFLASIIGVVIYFDAFLFEYISDKFEFVSDWMIAGSLGILIILIINLYIRYRVKSSDISYELITVAAHKLLTPLTEIHWGADSLLKNSRDFEERKTLNNILMSSEHLIGVSESLLKAIYSANKTQTFKKNKESVVELVKTAVRDISQKAVQKNIQLNVKLPEENFTSKIDKEKTRLAILGILQNAVDYTNQGGHINVEMRDNDDEIITYIRDSGIGITNEEKPRIFEKLYRGERALKSNTEGMGLGLFLTRQIMEGQGGEIGFESSGENKGSTFWFSLPIK